MDFKTARVLNGLVKLLAQTNDKSDNDLLTPWEEKRLRREEEKKEAKRKEEFHQSIYDKLTPWEKALVDAAYDSGYSHGGSDQSASDNDCTPTSYRSDTKIIEEALKEASPPENKS